MVEFKGEISKKVKLDRLKRVDKSSFKLSIAATIFLAIVTVAVIIIFELKTLWYALGFYGIFLIGIFLCYKFTPKNGALLIRIAPHICITEDEIADELCFDNETTWRRRKMSELKKVLDCGDVYYIFFKDSDMATALICQKNLIINGSIEEFEQIFAGRIIRDQAKK